jgi:hypothetical protein
LHAGFLQQLFFARDNLRFPAIEMSGLLHAVYLVERLFSKIAGTGRDKNVPQQANQTKEKKPPFQACSLGTSPFVPCHSRLCLCGDVEGALE